MKIIAILAALCAAPAAAQDACKQRGELQDTIEAEWGEVTVGYGMRVDKIEVDGAATVIEVWVSRDGTWSLTETHANGRACLIAYGTNWVFVEQPWPEMGGFN